MAEESENRGEYKGLYLILRRFLRTAGRTDSTADARGSTPDVRVNVRKGGDGNGGSTDENTQVRATTRESKQGRRGGCTVDNLIAILVTGLFTSLAGTASQ